MLVWRPGQPIPAWQRRPKTAPFTEEQLEAIRAVVREVLTASAPGLADIAQRAARQGVATALSKDLARY